MERDSEVNTDEREEEKEKEEVVLSDKGDGV